LILSHSKISHTLNTSPKIQICPPAVSALELLFVFLLLTFTTKVAILAWYVSVSTHILVLQKSVRSALWQEFSSIRGIFSTKLAAFMKAKPGHENKQL
jgi:hypothetical protein